MAVDGQSALRFFQDGAQGIDGRALARAVGTEEREDTALVYGE